MPISSLVCTIYQVGPNVLSKQRSTAERKDSLTRSRKPKWTFWPTQHFVQAYHPTLFFSSSKWQQTRLFDTTMVPSFMICCKPMGQVPSTVSSLTWLMSLQWWHCEGSIRSSQQVSEVVLELHMYFCKKKQDQRGEVAGRGHSAKSRRIRARSLTNPYTSSICLLLTSHPSGSWQSLWAFTLQSLSSLKMWCFHSLTIIKSSRQLAKTILCLFN